MQCVIFCWFSPSEALNLVSASMAKTFLSSHMVMMRPTDLRKLSSFSLEVESTLWVQLVTILIDNMLLNKREWGERGREGESVRVAYLLTMWKALGKTLLNSVLNSVPFFLLFCTISLARYSKVSLRLLSAEEKGKEISHAKIQLENQTHGCTSTAYLILICLHANAACKI